MTHSRLFVSGSSSLTLILSLSFATALSKHTFGLCFSRESSQSLFTDFSFLLSCLDPIHDIFTVIVRVLRKLAFLDKLRNFGDPICLGEIR